MDSVSPEPAVETASLTARRMARYLAIWAASLLLMLSAIVALCVVVDPYRVFGTPGIAGLTLQKPAAVRWSRLSKAYMVQRVHPATLILGSSSADVGFNPDSTAWPAAFRPVFNLAIDGGLPDTSLHYLRHALVSNNPTHVVIEVNFIESMVLPSGPMDEAAHTQFDFAPRMRVLANGTPNPGYARAHFADIVFATLSATSLSDSVDTILHQNNASEVYETEAGWNDGGALRRWAANDGFYQLMMNKDRAKIPQYAAWRRNKVLQIEPVLDMVRVARAHGAVVTLIIPPNYVDEMEALRQVGIDADYDAWKTALVAGAAAAAPDGGAVIWDFSGYTPYTTEALPPPGDVTHRLQFVWESVHFQSGLGDLMIARMTGAAEPANFGVRLTVGNVQGRIQAYHAAQASWITGHSADVARIGNVQQ
jgi:hypothetical protein